MVVLLWKVGRGSPCHPNRFSDALSIAPPELQNKLTLLEAAAHTGRLNISDAQNALKRVHIDSPETTDNERILAYHLRVLTRELAGSTKGMEKYIALGIPYNKALFSIHMGRSKLYQQAKTTAIQNLSALNGYPIPPKTTTRIHRHADAEQKIERFRQ